MSMSNLTQSTAVISGSIAKITIEVNAEFVGSDGLVNNAIYKVQYTAAQLASLLQGDEPNTFFLSTSSSTSIDSLPGGYTGGYLSKWPNSLLDTGFSRFLGGSGGEDFTGSDSADAFEGMSGSDTVDGSGGTDWLVFSNSPAGVSVNLDSGSATDGWGGTDTLFDIENVFGSRFADTIVGSYTDNRIEVSDGNDRIHFSSGLDTIDGGEGTDTLVVRGGLEDYRVSWSPNGYEIYYSFSPDDTSLLSNVERIEFADASVNLTVQVLGNKLPEAEVSQIIELYIAFFNRIPDSDGLAYWFGQRASGTSLDQIADTFYQVGANDFSALTGFSAEMSTSEFVNVFYENVLGRSDGADSDGLAYWTSRLAQPNKTRGSIAREIIAAARTYDGDQAFGWVVDLLDNKIEVGRRVALHSGLTLGSSNSDTFAISQAIARKITPDDISAALSLIGVPLDAITF